MNRIAVAVVVLGLAGPAHSAEAGSNSLVCKQAKADPMNADLNERCKQAMMKEFDRLAAQDRAKQKYFMDVEFPKLIDDANTCMLQWTKIYATSTQEAAAVVVDAAYGKCLKFTNPLTGIMHNMSGTPEVELADTFKKKFITTVLDARIKVGDFPASQPRTPAKGF